MTKKWLLLYDYVEGIAEKRAPYREDHLALIESYDEIEQAGAVGDPPHGAIFVFTREDRIHDFADADPYRRAGLVTAMRVEAWTVPIDRR